VRSDASNPARAQPIPAFQNEVVSVERDCLTQTVKLDVGDERVKFVVFERRKDVGCRVDASHRLFGCHHVTVRVDVGMRGIVISR